MRHIVPLVIFAVALVACGRSANGPAVPSDGGSDRPDGAPDAGGFVISDASSISDAGDAGTECDRVDHTLPSCFPDEGAPDWIAVSDRPLGAHLADANPREPVDSLEIRIRGSVFASSGTPCASATDRAACMDEFDSVEGGSLLTLSSPPVIRRGSPVYTRGDTVGLVNSIDDLVAFLGEVDRAVEAILILLTERDSFYVGQSPLMVREVADGYEVLAWYPSEICWPVVESLVAWHVSTTGELTQTCSRVLSCQARACI